RVVRGDGRGSLRGLGTEVTLPHHAVTTYQKCHHAGGVVLGRPGEEREPTCQVAVDDIGFGPAGGVRSLRGEDLEEIPVERRRGPRRLAGGSPFRGRLGDQLTERAQLLAPRRRPVEAVLPARVAAEGNRVAAGRLAVASFL